MHLRVWFFVVLLLGLYVAAEDDATCSATKRCEEGCCNKSGNYGFGPDYYGKSVYRSDYDRKSECNLGFGKEWAKSNTCPLNICCSKHRYCGTTKDFYRTKKVKCLSYGKSGDMERIVFSPKQIPIGLYTHINFAFSTINLNTFKIKANDEQDLDMYQRLIPTAKVFSDLAASVARQRSFFNSIMVAKKRAGQAVNYKNFPIFIATLKRVIDTADKGLTITLLEPTVEFFNIMSYDLHSPYLNAHTNLTEIDSVVMGLGFYGHAFAAASAACRKPGYLFSDIANAGSYSGEEGILLNSEIDIKIKNRNLKPELYKEEAVKVMKVERAAERYLGGVIVWAISHDTKEAKYNKALAKVLGREVISGSLDDDEKAADFIKKPNKQCQWSNCKEGCPKGWVNVGRLDSGAQKGELIYDEMGCGGDSIYSFCYLPDEDIPHGISEIRTNNMYYKKESRMQMACCKTNTKSMKLYGTCQWGDYPECETSPDCPDNYWLMAWSGSGSGALKCNDRVNDIGNAILSVQLRNYCCINKPGERFIDCTLHRSIGPAPDNSISFCRSGCPDDQVRVLVPNDKLKAYDEAIAAWVKSETCPNPYNVFTKHRRSLSSSTRVAAWSDDIDDITGPSQIALEILCNPLEWANWIKAFLTGDKDALASIMDCTYGYCDKDRYCENLGDGDDDSADLKHRHASLLPYGSGHMHPSHFTYSYYHYYYSRSNYLLEA
ncbi:hypothetical protein LCI18_003759 [Fusarium solani-melongenae]|uniref:Uncharacterized protein n=1 Tax=Fusarium solani subsp. cucurbitae TaxID=2747967 RepID=A0ACD3YV08_FUSSC|nr:hypothetical protein LCI18_003759 [Fusarium solani-melongenae]